VSYKWHAEKVGEAHYVIPKFGEMRTDVHAFLSPALYEASDEELWDQAVASAGRPGAIGMYLMPDCHVGYSIPVGGVLVTEDVIVQAGSGYDISCGVIYLKSTLAAADVADFAKRRAWVDAVEERISTGYSRHQPRRMKTATSELVDDILRHGAQAIGVDAELCERQFIRVPEEVDLRSIERAYEKTTRQLGSVGGGNHFVEMQVDRDDGSVWLMVHCGSRGYGWQTANHFFTKGAELRGLPSARREESWLRADEPLGKEYWAHHNAAANYAIANRWTIVNGLTEATAEVFGGTLEPYYEISHNLVQEETLLLPDGSTQRGFVHRKGATRAFPAGHPDLAGTRWEATGHPCLIPGSMYDGAAILFPRDGARRSGCSVNHGSGRTMGRNAAKRELGALQAEINREMRQVKRVLGGVEIEGIVSNCRDIPIDECAHVYKALDEVLGVLRTEDIASVERRLYPVANIKGAD
jgi:tRNA-splicing ligase RtcB